MDILLIAPPALKPSEPPLSLAVLLGYLKAQGLQAGAIDSNLDALFYLLEPERAAAQAGDSPSTAVRRALTHIQSSLDLLRSSGGARSFSRYETAVLYLNRVLGLWRGATGRERLTLGDYQHRGLSPFDPAALEALARGEHATLFAPWFADQLLPRVAVLAPKVVSLSINYVHQALPAFELAGMLRRAFPQIQLVAGGGLLTSWKEPLTRLGLRLYPFDRVVFGPGEASLAALARSEALPDYFLEDASAIGFAPDFSFAEPGAYLSPESLLPVSATRGCYWKRCLFCPEAAAPVHPYTCASPGDFPDLLLHLHRETGARHFHLTDNALPMNVLRALASRAADLTGINWFGFVRFEEALAEEGFADRLFAAGCRVLQLGLESGSQAVLDRLGKGILLETASAILTALHRAGIATYVYIMLGTPGETRADAEKTLAFLQAHADRIGFLNLSVMNLPESSGLLDDPAHFGIAASAPLDTASPLGLYRSFESSTGWGRAEARRFLDKNLLGDPAIRVIAQRTPPLFTSNHAVFFRP